MDEVDSIEKASDELHNMANDESGQNNEVAVIAVFCDGRWQQQGFSSLNRVLTMIASGNGKCVDYWVKSKQCASCTSWESWKSFMESEKTDVYASHIGDGETKSDSKVVKKICIKEQLHKSYNLLGKSKKDLRVVYEN